MQNNCLQRFFRIIIKSYLCLLTDHFCHAIALMLWILTTQLFCKELVLYSIRIVIL